MANWLSQTKVDQGRTWATTNKATRLSYRIIALREKGREEILTQKKEIRPKWFGNGCNCVERKRYDQLVWPTFAPTSLTTDTKTWNWKLWILSPTFFANEIELMSNELARLWETCLLECMRKQQTFFVVFDQKFSDGCLFTLHNRSAFIDWKIWIPHVGQGYFIPDRKCERHCVFNNPNSIQKLNPNTIPPSPPTYSKLCSFIKHLIKHLVIRLAKIGGFVIWKHNHFTSRNLFFAHCPLLTSIVWVCVCVWSKFDHRTRVINQLDRKFNSNFRMQSKKARKTLLCSSLTDMIESKFVTARMLFQIFL